MTPMMIVADMFILFGQFSDEFTQEIGKHACKARQAIREEQLKNRTPTLKERLDTEVKAELKKRDEQKKKKK